MDYETMRLKCLELATQQGFKGGEAVLEAARMIKFAREGLDNDKIETPKATVHKRPPFLDDYKPE